jgi:hypothetical protein
MHYEDFKRVNSFYPKRIQPTVHQFHLLNACLAEETSAFEISWKMWVQLQDFDHLDNESLKLIPTLFKQIDLFKLEDANFPRYRGIYKKNWVSNLKMQKDVTSFFEMLAKSSIAYRLIGNFPTLHRIYQDLSIVRLTGIELIVSLKNSSDLLVLLEQANFKPRGNQLTQKEVLRRLKLGYSCPYEDSNGWLIHVSYSGFPFRVKKEAFAVFDSNNSKLQVDTLTIDTVDIEFDLIRILVHGFAGSSLSQLLWVVDVQRLLKLHQHTIDWTRFILIAKQKDVAYLVSLSLRYLRNFPTIQIPDEVEARLGEKPSVFNRVIYAHVKHRSKITGFLKRFFIG